MNSIQIKTEIPGPRSRELAARRKVSVVNAQGSAAPVYIAGAEGCFLTDVDGNVFLDFAGGIGTVNSGHRNPVILDKVKSQLEDYLHVCFTVVPYEPYITLAECLNEITPGNFAKKTLLVNSGAEAVENAVKVARYYTKREGIIVLEDAFHGRTFMTMSMTHKEMPFKHGFGPFASCVYRLPFPYDTKSVDANHFINELYDLLDRLGKEKIAAIVIELVTGEGGFLPANPGFVHEVRKVCTNNGIILVIDEVQTAFGRTGKMFASEWYDLEPDIITLAKSMSGGLPISAVTGRAEMMDCVHLGGLGGTFGGNPVACQSALGAIEIIERLESIGRLAELARTVPERMNSISNKSRFVSDVRGIGCMYSLEVSDGSSENNPSKEKASEVLNLCLQDGLIMILSGEHGNVIRTLFPLTISDDYLELGMSIIEKHLMEENNVN